MRALVLLLAFPMVLPARDDAAIKDVMNGQRAEARADWWGFNKTDATPALQAAINSPAKKVIIPNTGKPWIVQPIKLRSDLELVFEKGVEVQALRGAFQKPSHSLFAASNAKNLTLTGAEGVTLRMWKSDYQQQPYAKSEWRHTLSFHGCENVTITGLMLRDSGGDGIYLGTGAAGGCKRIAIHHVHSIGHHRQGISVISADHLLIEDCEFSETSGTAPMAGIDFEPNSASERLSDCVLRRCRFDRNAAYGVLFALGKLDASSEPLSITLEDCTATGNPTALMFAMRNPAGVRGQVEFTRCTFAESTNGGIVLRTKTQPGPRLTFTQCVFRQLATAAKEDAPIAIVSRSEQGDPIGGIRFDRCEVVDSKQRQPIYYDDVGGLRLMDLTGTLLIKNGDTQKTLELTPQLLAQWFPWSSELKAYERQPLELQALAPAFPEASLPASVFQGWLRGDAHFALHVAKPGALRFTVTSKGVGKKDSAPPIGVQLIAPSGKKTRLDDAKTGTAASYEVKVMEPGLYQLECEAHQNAVSLGASSVPASVLAPSGAFHFIYACPPMAFLVPAGVKEFAVRVAGDGGLEQARAIIVNAQGKTVADEDNIARSKAINLKREDASKPEIWTLELARPKGAVIEDVHVMLDGLPAVVAGTARGLLVKQGGATPLYHEPANR